MSNLQNLGNISNEKKEQRILILHSLFKAGNVLTITGAAKHFGLSEATIIKYCKAGNIPMLDHAGQAIVPMTEKNRPDWWDVDL